MTKSIKVFLSTAFFAVLAVSCRESIEPATPAEEGKGTIDICVNGLMGEYTQQDGVKSSLVNNVRVAWAAGDVVYVFDGSKYLGKLTAALDKKADGQTDEDRYAKLGGTISAPATTPCVLSLVHSSLMTEPAAGAAVSELSIDMSAQSTETAPFVAYATLDYTGSTTITNAVVPFKFATSVIKVNCTGLKAKTAIDKATLSNVNTVCKLTLSGTGAPTVSAVTNGTITRTGDAYFADSKVNSEGEAVFQIAVPALETASGARILTVAQGSDEVKDKNFSKKAIDPATSVNTVCQLVGPPAGAIKCEFTVSDDDGATTKQIYFSKGNLWADDSNALFFEDAQWKSTPASDGVKDTCHISHFTWSSTVDAAVGGSNNGNNLFTNVDGFTVNVDGKEQTGWRTLSTKEWQYLFNKDNTYGVNNRSGKYQYGVTICGKENCVVLLPDNWEWDETADEHHVGTGWQDGGYPETQTGNEVTWKKMEDAGAVCLPAAGDRDGSDVDHVGGNGFYWSSAARDENYAYFVYFNSSNVVPDDSDRRRSGYSVRLITECQ